MYHTLLEMKDFDEDKFDRLLQTLKAYDDWESRTFNWCIMERNRRYQDSNPNKTRPHYKGNAFGLMQQLRNYWEHPAKLYKQFLIAVLLGEFSKLLSDVQQALYDAGYLPQMDVENMD